MKGTPFVNRRYSDWGTFSAKNSIQKGKGLNLADGASLYKTLLSTPPLALVSLIVLFHLYVKSIHKGPKWKKGWHNDEVNFLSKDQLTKKKDRILIKDLISNNWKYKTKEARLILQFEFKL